MSTIRVHAVPGRLYPHPDGHRLSSARFLGRGPAVLGIEDPADCDARFPIVAEGALIEEDSDIVRAIQHGDLARECAISKALAENTAQLTRLSGEIAAFHASAESPSPEVSIAPTAEAPASRE